MNTFHQQQRRRASILAPLTLALAIGAPPALAEVLPVANHSFEDDGIGSADFLDAAPAGWVRVVPANRVVGVIGEDRGSVPNTSHGIAWVHLQTDSNDSNPAANPPRIGQRLGALDDAVFGNPTLPKLWVHFLAGKRLAGNKVVDVTVSLYAVPAGAGGWTGGTLIDSGVFATTLVNLIDGDPGSTAEGVVPLELNNAAAQAAHPGGDYWFVIANTMTIFTGGGDANSASQLQLDRVSAQTGDDNDPGPYIQPPPPIDSGDQVAGDLILFNDNGGWCWYQDERVRIDRDNDSLVIASAANYLGYGGEPRDGDLDVVTFEPATGTRTLVTLANIPTLSKGDDHNVPALWQRPDGRYYAKYTGHLYGNGAGFGGNDPKSFHRTATLANSGAAWDPEQVFDWPKNDTTSPINNDVTYTNLHFLPAEGTGQGRLYNIARAADRTPNIAYSDDRGATWTYGGKLSTSTTGSSYSNGYFVFASNGVDRIDFMATEHHPRNYNNSIYHGYIKGGKSYDSSGLVVDTNIFDELAPAPQDFTPVWSTSAVTSTSYHHAWTMEVEVAGDGTIHGLFTTRYGTQISDSQPGDADHRLFHARFDGVSWHTTELCKMGNGLHGGENDYTGLGSIHPNDPSTIYVSAEHDPRDGTALPRHEIFKGITADNGANWSWTPITEKSTVENLRPIVPAWDGGHTALLWLRGRYPFQRDYDESVVGIIDKAGEHAALVHYLDADIGNTTLANGAPLYLTGPADTDGPAEGLWHEHTGLGNLGNAITANESGSENTPTIRTTLDGLQDGTYDVYAYFWSRPGDDWRIRAGFSTSELLVFRRYSCQQAEEGQFAGSITVRDEQQALYRAYVGRRTVSGGAAIEVFLDDFDGAAIAGAQRSAYDGIGAAYVFTSEAGIGFCFGDPGSGTPCPCNNNNDGSVPGSGCANGVFVSGARLSAFGSASVSADSLVLWCTGLEPNNSGLYFQADNDLSPGNAWGDGLQCAGGQLRRLGVRFSDENGYSDTSGYSTSISVKAGNVLAGDTKYYQCWYRNPTLSPCFTDFNASNGYAITWLP